VLAPGDKFDRYVIAGLLGQGGMGEVYRAHDTRLQRTVALKIVREAQLELSQPGTRSGARVLREARSAAAFNHPNVVAVFDVGAADGAWFLAMELVVGSSMRAFIGDPSVSLEEKLRWSIDVARALSAAHQRGIVHRDLKPENVMVGEDGVVKVLDFGIARRVGAPVDPSASTRSSVETLTGKGVGFRSSRRF
jgi:serine/threonine-protein kinase